MRNMFVVATICGAVAFSHGAEASTPCAPRDVLQNIVAPSGRVSAHSTEAFRNVWKTITLGQFVDTFALRNALDAAGCGIGDLAEEILARPSFALSATKVDVDLVVASGVELGAPKEPSLADVYARAQAHGLALVPAEVGPQLRLQYLDQPIGEFLHVGMAPIYTWAGQPVILVLANGGAGLVLIGQNGGLDAKVSETSHFLFVRPRVLAKEP